MTKNTYKLSLTDYYNRYKPPSIVRAVVQPDVTLPAILMLTTLI